MIESLKKNKKGMLLMVISSLFVCFGQLFWKLFEDSNYIYLLIGFILYGFGALIMLYAYKFGKLSILQPTLSINYVFSFIIAHYILKEIITIYKAIGILIIILGVILIGGGDK